MVDVSALAKFSSLGLRSGKLMAGVQYAMTLRNCRPDMATYSENWNLRDCVADSTESWLKEFICSDSYSNNRLLESVPL